VISGFNTDVEFDGVVYHVQTEDKGLSARKIITLVYDRGTILASKRTPYEAQINGDFDEASLAEHLQKQHSLICAAIRAGRIADLKKMSAKPSPAVEDSVPANFALPPDVLDAGVPPVESPPDNYSAAEIVPFVQPEIATELRTVEPLFDEEIYPPTEDPFFDAPIVDSVSIIEDDEVLPTEAVEVVSELSGRDRPSNFKLGLALLDDVRFRGGDCRTVRIMVCRGTSQRVVADAQIMIKVLGSGFRPVVFHARSDINGLAAVHLQLPHFRDGRAALLVRAMDQGEEIELRRIVTPG
jgi:hypothetical protein